MIEERAGIFRVRLKAQLYVETEMERNERVVKHLKNAVETMHNACEEAGRAIAKGNDQYAARRVLHAFAWGFANASGSIENAMSALEDAQSMKDAEAPHNTK